MSDPGVNDPVVLVDIADRVAVITLNRPDQRNALNRAIRKRLPQVITDARSRRRRRRDDPHRCRSGVLGRRRPEGVRFRTRSAPAEPAPTADMGSRDDDGRLPFRGALPPRTKLLIGAINGVAVTGGLEVALGCDFLVASDRARFADTHARVGVMPGWGLTVLLPQRVGVARAREMSVTGNYVDAATALVWGLVNHVVPHEELLPFAKQLAADVVSNDPMGVRQMLQTYAEGSLGTAEAAWTLEDRVSREWEGPGFDPASIEARRQKIIDRGRAQQG